MHIMGYLFREARQGEAQKGALELIKKSSPVRRVIAEYFALLGRWEDSYWLLITAGEPWTVEQMLMVFSWAVIVAGSLEMRCVRPFGKNPWIMAVMSDPSTDIGTSTRLKGNFFYSCTKCRDKGFAERVHASLTSIEDLDDASLNKRIHESIKRAPVNNVPSEDRFARQAIARSYCHGHFASQSTMCTKHVLGEAKCLHNIALKRRDCKITITCSMCESYHCSTSTHACMHDAHTHTL